MNGIQIPFFSESWIKFMPNHLGFFFKFYRKTLSYCYTFLFISTYAFIAFVFEIHLFQKNYFDPCCCLNSCVIKLGRKYRLEKLSWNVDWTRSIRLICSPKINYNHQLTPFTLTFGDGNRSNTIEYGFWQRANHFEAPEQCIHSTELNLIPVNDSIKCEILICR